MNLFVYHGTNSVWNNHKYIKAVPSAVDPKSTPCSLNYLFLHHYWPICSVDCTECPYQETQHSPSITHPTLLQASHLTPKHSFCQPLSRTLNRAAQTLFQLLFQLSILSSHLQPALSCPSPATINYQGSLLSLGVSPCAGPGVYVFTIFLYTYLFSQSEFESFWVGPQAGF